MDTPCVIILEDTKCSEVGIYVVHITNCPTCADLGWLFCAGHRMCVEHGAEIREEQYIYDGADPVRVTAERMSAVYRKAS